MSKDAKMIGRWVIVMALLPMFFMKGLTVAAQEENNVNEEECVRQCKAGGGDELTADDSNVVKLKFLSNNNGECVTDDFALKKT